MLPKVGETYTSRMGERRNVTKITENYVSYLNIGRQIHRSTSLYTFMQLYMGGTQPKPLDQAFKTMDKPTCKHNNTRKDKFFTRQEYVTCVDCGLALN